MVSLPNRADGTVPQEGDKIDVGWPAAAAVVLAEEGERGQVVNRCAASIERKEEP